MFAILYLASFTQHDLFKVHPNYNMYKNHISFSSVNGYFEVDSCFSTASSTSAVVSCLLITAIFMSVKSFIASDLHFSYDGAHIGIYLNGHPCVFFGYQSTTFVQFKVGYLLIFILQEFFNYFGQQSLEIWPVFSSIFTFKKAICFFEGTVASTDFNLVGDQIMYFSFVACGFHRDSWPKLVGAHRLWNDSWEICMGLN